MQCGEHAGTSGSSPESLSFLAVLMRALGRDEKIFLKNCEKGVYSPGPNPHNDQLRSLAFGYMIACGNCNCKQLGRNVNFIVKAS